MARFLSSIGVPQEMTAEITPALEPVAHTLVYDCTISNETTFEMLRSVGLQLCLRAPAP